MAMKPVTTMKMKTTRVAKDDLFNDWKGSVSVSLMNRETRFPRIESVKSKSLEQAEIESTTLGGVRTPDEQ